MKQVMNYNKDNGLLNMLKEDAERKRHGEEHSRGNKR